ncbi:MAG: hypothetical protein HOV81_18075 [Kofleriaceae bacterium]|nr:hypothetical protein [Kofleriaceae bacterium]
MTIDLPTPSSDALRIEASFDSGVLTARFVGTADLETRSYLDAVVQRLHAQALREKAATVVVDFRELEFMSSSSFKVFVSWLGAVRELPSDLQYGITLRSNPELHWQRRSLSALSAFAGDLVALET